MCSYSYTINIDVSIILVIIKSNNIYKLYGIVTNMVLNNLLVSLVYELLRKYFLYDETYHIYLSLMYANTTLMLTLIKS
jgi:hypothetical protein